ncbi:MAG: TonB-dependent receptor [Pseudomonadota bacterium]
MRFFVLSVTFILLAIANTAIAAPPAELGEIEVRESPAAKREPSLDKTADAAVVLPSEAKELGTTIPQLLERSAGVYVKRYGGLDDFAAISLRGSTAQQIQIYLDDVPLASPQGDIVDLSLIPLDVIDRIEVYKGGSPGIIPDSTVGGVVVLKTKKRPEKTETTIRNTGASFTTYKGLVSRAQAVGRFSYVAAYERYQSDGDFTYLDNNGTTFNAADDVLTTRKNNNFASNSLYSKMMVELSKDAHLSFSNSFFNKDQGVPGLGNRQSLIARLETWRDVVSAAADKDFSSIKGLSGHADLFFDFLNNQFSNPNGQIGIGIQRNDDDTYRFGENFRATYLLGSHQQLKGFVSHRGEYFCPVNWAATPSHGPHSGRNSLNAGAEDEIILFADRLSIVPSARLSSIFNDLTNQDPSQPTAFVSTNSRVDNQLSAKLGASIRLIDELRLKGNIYRGFRNPTFSELFGDRGTLVGNATLRPEESFNVDASLSYSYRKDENRLSADFEATYFRNSVDNLIQFLQTSQFTVRAQNTNKALINGMELSARAAWAERLSAYANYTFQDARDASSLPATSGKYLPGRPRHELNAGVTWSKPWAGWISTRLSGEINYMSGNYLDTQNLLSVNNRTIVSAGLAAIILKDLTLSFTVRNLTNEMISDLVGFPLPGRSYWGTMEVKI